MKYKQLTKELQTKIDQRDAEIESLRAEIESLKKPKQEEVIIKPEGKYTLRDRENKLHVFRWHNTFDACSDYKGGYFRQYELSVEEDGKIYDILNGNRIDMTNRFEIVPLTPPEGDQT